MMTLLLFQYFSFILVQGLGQSDPVEEQSSKSALMEKVASEPKMNIHCVIYFTDKSYRDIATSGLSVPLIIYQHRNNRYFIVFNTRMDFLHSIDKLLQAPAPADQEQY